MAKGNSPVGSAPHGTGAVRSSRSRGSTTDYVENGYVDDGYIANEAGGPRPDSLRNNQSESDAAHIISDDRPITAEVDQLTFDGDPLTFEGEPLTIGGNRVMTRKPKAAQEPTQSERAISVDAASWTGFSSSAEKAQAVRVMLPAAIGSIETLIAHYEVQGGNGGPPLEERAAILQDLRSLHRALGALIDASADEWWAQYGDGLVVEAVRLLGRVKSAVCNDPLPLAIAGLSEVILGVFGIPGAGTLATAAALGAKKR